MAPPTSPKSPKSTRKCNVCESLDRLRMEPLSLVALEMEVPEAYLFDEFAQPSWERPGFSRPPGWFHDHGRDGRGDQGLEIGLNV
jgi:hypothetical protein